MATCAGCKAPVKWRKTPAGRYLALDPARIYVRLILAADATEEERAGPRRNLVRDNLTVVVGFEVPAGSTRGEVVAGYEAHWSTCPEALRFRR